MLITPNNSPSLSTLFLFAFAFNYKLKGEPTNVSHLPDLRTAQSGALSTKIKSALIAPASALFTTGASEMKEN